MEEVSGCIAAVMWRWTGVRFVLLPGAEGCLPSTLLQPLLACCIIAQCLQLQHFQLLDSALLVLQGTRSVQSEMQHHSLQGWRMQRNNFWQLAAPALRQVHGSKAV